MPIPNGSRGSLKPSFDPDSELTSELAPVNCSYSTSMSHSQADLCFCAYSPISYRTKSTFVYPRYFFAGACPRQTSNHTLFPGGFHHRGLDSKMNKGGVPLASAACAGTPSYARQYSCSYQCKDPVKLHGVFLSCIG